MSASRSLSRVDVGYFGLGLVYGGSHLLTSGMFRLKNDVFSSSS